jgi:hypothetical protein
MAVNNMGRVHECELPGEGRRQNQLEMVDDCESDGEGRLL